MEDQLSPEARAVLHRIMSKPNLFDPLVIAKDPIEAWRYAHKEKEVTPAQRHHLLRSIAAVRRWQGGRIDEERTARMLEEVLRSGAPTTP